RRKLLAFGGLRDILVARAADEARTDDSGEEHLCPAGGHDRVREVVEPDDAPAGARLGRDQLRGRMLGFEIVDDRAGIGEAIITIQEGRYLLERTGRAEFRRVIGKSGWLKVELQ